MNYKSIEEYTKIISTSYQQSDNGLVAKSLYCYFCGEKLFGEVSSGTARYDCLNCGFFIYGDEAFYLYVAFREDLV